MEMDDGLDLIDKAEADTMKQEQKKLKSRAEGANSYREAFKQKARQVRATRQAAEATQPPNKRRRGAPKAGAQPALGNMRRPRIPDGEITQPEAKALLPPDCSIWRQCTVGGWCVDLEGHGRQSALWSKFGGEHASMLHILRNVWRLRLQDWGMDESECPVQHLFPQASSAPNSSAARSSRG